MRRKQHRVILEREDADFVERLAARLRISIAELLRRWIRPELERAKSRGLPEPDEDAAA